ncbi:hypothetical protein ES319_D01G091400v1 [Gossypium barbadense]|uniref:Uncharacterized protein n=1 Tax=Gossypium barbadense TaxID=3634 RepID=A0A5J5SLG6_GOSBA|nr:hypothetical protein ES319_D01G091400v1 [Gossypium barbadense]KAB2044457.1 hypothetical protein ES319_D01G091400v1 [Gossypium barbadense]
MTKQTQMTVFIIAVMFLCRFAVIVPRSTRFFRSKDSPDLASTIAELNKEMESVFGEPPPDGLANSGNRSCMAQDAHHNSHVILVLCLKNLLFEVPLILQQLTNSLLEMEEEKAIQCAREKASIEAIEEKRKLYNS